MTRTTIMLPGKLKSRAARAAKRQGISLAGFIRNALEARLRGDRASDPLFAEAPLTRDKWPADVAANHDLYLLKLLEQEHGIGKSRSKRKAS